MLIVFFVDVFRALPPLVIIIMLYFALPTVGIRMSGFVSTWLALTLVLMAFCRGDLLGRHHSRCRAGSGRRRAPPA